ncbi:hypothetical protein [Pseudactinotalea sp. Z1748]|uniref:hypothetical protein n=1 Tax=Pseudactinotalea sp. Z1748 TaxID=3413027 RepID=UPI003C7E0628
MPVPVYTRHSMFFIYLIVWTAWGIGARWALGPTYVPWLLRMVRTPGRALLVYGAVFVCAVIVAVVLVQMTDRGAGPSALLIVLGIGTMPLAPLVMDAIPGKGGGRAELHRHFEMYRRQGRLREVGAEDLSVGGQRAVGLIAAILSLVTLGPLMGGMFVVMDP